MTLPDYLNKLQDVAQKMEQDEYHTEPKATIQTNAPLALMQIAHNVKLATIKGVITDLQQLTQSPTV